jgi:hypothetical protein
VTGPIFAANLSQATGRPLLSAAQLAALYGVQPKTVHAWEARGRLHAVGLDEHGVRLFDALDAAKAEAAPHSRARRKNQLPAVMMMRARPEYGEPGRQDRSAACPGGADGERSLPVLRFRRGPAGPGERTATRRACVQAAVARQAIGYAGYLAQDLGTLIPGVRLRGRPWNRPRIPGRPPSSALPARTAERNACP